LLESFINTVLCFHFWVLITHDLHNFFDVLIPSLLRSNHALNFRLLTLLCVRVVSLLVAFSVLYLCILQLSRRRLLVWSRLLPLQKYLMQK
jgi:hypothetical protein